MSELMTCRTAVIGWVLALMMAVPAVAQSDNENWPGMGGFPGVGDALPGMGDTGPADDLVNSDVDTREPAATGPEIDNALLIDATLAGKRIVAVGERGIILLSDDHGATWRQASVPVRVLLTAIDFVDEKHGWAVGHDAVVLHSSDGGETWAIQHYAPELDAPMLDVVAMDRNRLLISAALGILFKTVDGGQSWTQDRLSMTLEGYLGTTESFDDFTPHWFAIAAARDGTLYLAGERGVIARSEDEGDNWRQLESPYSGSLFGISFLPDTGLVVHGMRGNVFASRDAGDSWRKLTIGSERSVNASVTMPDGSLVLAAMAGNLLVSRDGGVSFSALPQPNRADILKALPLVDGGSGADLLLLTSRGKRLANARP